MRTDEKDKDKENASLIRYGQRLTRESDPDRLTLMTVRSLQYILFRSYMAVSSIQAISSLNCRYGSRAR